MGRAPWIWFVVVVAVALAGWLALGAPSARPPAVESLDTSEAERVPSPGPLLDSGAAATGRVTERVGRGTVEIAGRVVDLDGAGVPSRVVRALRRVVPTPERFFYAGGQPRELEAEVWQKRQQPVTTADAEGHFLLRGLALDGRYLLSVDTQGSELVVPAFVALDAEVGAADVRIVVTGGTPLRCRVVDAAGNGLAALVSLHVPGSNETVDAAVEGWKTQDRPTDADGTIQFGGVPLGKLHLNVLVPGRIKVGCVHLTAPHDGTFVVRVPREGQAGLAGRVTDSSGAPVARAKVVASPQGDDEASGWSVRATHTDAEGLYAFSGLPQGVLNNLAVHAEGHPPVPQSHADLPLLAGKTARADVVLPVGVTLAGVVLDPDGSPLKDIRVRVMDPASMMPSLLGEATSGADGRFRIGSVREGALLVQAEGAGWFLVDPKRAREPADFGGIMRRIMGGGRRIQRRVADEAKDLRLVLQRGIQVVGEVVDSTERSVAGAVVTATNAEGRRTFTDDRTTVVAGDDGRFRLPPLRPGVPWQVSAKVGTRVSAPVAVPAAAAEGMRSVRIVVRASSELQGTVLGPEDEPLAGMAVEIEALDLQMTTGEDGRFTLRGLPAGVHRLTWEPYLGYWPDHGGSMDVDPATLEGPLVLRWERVGRVEGVVVDEGGGPVEGVRVCLYPEGLEAYKGMTSRTEEDGSFVVRWLGRERLRIQLDGKDLEETAEAGARGVRLVLDRVKLVTLAGRLLDPDGRPLSSASIKAYDGSEEREDLLDRGSVFGMRPGVFSLDLKDPPERITLVVEDAVRANGVRDLLPRLTVTDVDPRRTEPLDITVPRGLVFGGHVRDAAGAPVPGAVVEIESAMDGALRSFLDVVARATADEQGAFRVTGLGPGAVGFAVLPIGDFSGRTGLTGAAGQENVEVRLERGREIRGVVVDAAGRPVPGAWVRAFDGGTKRWTRAFAEARLEAVTDARGLFTLRGVSASHLHLVVGPQSQHAETWPHPILELDAVDVDSLTRIQLAEGARLEVEIVDPSGEPVANRTVVLTAEEGETSAFLQPVADGSNHYRSELVPVGIYHLRVLTGDGYLGTERSGVRLPAAPLRLSVPRAYVVSGRIQHEAAAGFDVEFIGMHGADEIEDDDSARGGTFTLSLSAPARGLVYASHARLGLYALIEGLQAPREGLVLRPVAGQVLAGRVPALVGKAGQVRVTHASGVTWTDWIMSKDGSFSFRAVPPGRCTVEVRVGVRVLRTEAAAGDTDVVVR